MLAERDRQLGEVELLLQVTWAVRHCVHVLTGLGCFDSLIVVFDGFIPCM